MKKAPENQFQLYASTFHLKTNLTDTQLRIQLKDYVDNVMYEGVYTKANIGKQISMVMNLKTIYIALSSLESDNNGLQMKNEEMPNYIDYIFGNVITKNKMPCYKIEKGGKITIYKTLTDEMTKQIQKYQSELILTKIKEISQKKIINDKLNYENIIREKKTNNKLFEMQNKIQNLVNKLNYVIKQNKQLKQQIQILKQNDKSHQQMIEKLMKQYNNKKKFIESQITITILKLTGQKFQIKCYPSDDIQEVKYQISNKINKAPDELRLIFAGKQLQDGRKLKDYNISQNTTLHLVERLRGDIGIFDYHLNTPFHNFLMQPTNNNNIRGQQIQQLINLLKGNQFAQFSVQNLQINNINEQINKLINYANQCYEQSKQKQMPIELKDQINDLKITLTKQKLIQLIGQQLTQKLQIIFQDKPTEIVIRRCQTHGKMINFHTDFSHKTLQLSLNDDSQYKGGKLTYATQKQLITPKRNKGTVTVHNNKIVHGVTKLDEGIRYGLFYLIK